jgi:hypothetical protein
MGVPMTMIPKDPRTVRQSPARKLAEELRAKKQGGEVETKKPATKLDGFGGVRGHTGTTPLGLMQQGQPRGGITGANALLGAMTGDLQVQATEGPRLKKTDGGRILTGDVTITHAQDLEVLRGVELLRGDLVIEESGLQGADLSALEGVRAIEGNLGLEGNRSLQDLSALKQLQRLEGNLYVGFNGGLTEASLPSLQKVGGALILEGNEQLAKLDLPNLESVGRYLSVVENPRLTEVSTPALQGVADVEAYDNGADLLSGLPAA